MDLDALLERILFPGFPRDNLDAWTGLTPEERILLHQHRSRDQSPATVTPADKAEPASSAGSSNDPPLHMQECLSRQQLDRLTLVQQVERYGTYAPPDPRNHKHCQRFFKQKGTVMKPHIKRWVNDYIVKRSSKKNTENY